MKVSVLMPMRNAAPYVREAVFSVLAENSLPIELIVIDDGSTDGSSEIVASINDRRMRIVPGPQKGIAACLNTGLSHATGDIVMRCDADDLYPPGRIRRQVAFLAASPGAIAVCGGFSFVDSEGRTIAEPYSVGKDSGPVDISAELVIGELKTHLCTFGIRKSAAVFDIGFREYFETAEDIDFALRLGMLGPVIFFSDTSYLYRLHGHSITHSTSSQRGVFFDEQAKRFALQRQKSGADDLMRGFAERPPERDASPRKASNHILDLMIGEAWRLYLQGDKGAAFDKAKDALRRYPSALGAWNLLARLSLKYLLQSIRKS